MAKYSVKVVIVKKEWEDFVLSQNPKSFLQSWNWGETNIIVGENIWRLGIYKGEMIVGACLVIKQLAKRGPHFIVPGGPLINWEDSSAVDLLISHIKNLAKKEGAWFVRIRPELLDTYQNRSLFAGYGFVRSPMHLHAEHTWLLDTSGTEESILSGMRKNTRYSVRQSEKSDLTLEVTKKLSKTKLLLELQKETVDRHKFVGFSDKLFKAQLESFGKDDEALLYLIRKENDLLVAAIIIFYGEYAYYHHSASSEKARRVPASYFLQWRVILETKKRKLLGYNFWGVAPEGVENHRFSGVTTFKTGFGGQRITWLPAQDLPIDPKYWFTYVFETVRKKMRGL